MISNKDNDHLTRAVRIALQGTERHRHGAVVVKSGRVLGVGVNTFRNLPNSIDVPDVDRSVHAEMNAMRQVSLTALEGATVYVARVLKDATPALSSPCLNCLKELHNMKVKRVVWTTGEELSWASEMRL